MIDRVPHIFVDEWQINIFVSAQEAGFSPFMIALATTGRYLPTCHILQNSDGEKE